MKRYKINRAYKTNKSVSKTGLKWKYEGKTDDWQSVVDDYNNYPTVTGDGIRVTDTETNEVIYEHIR